MVIYSGKKSSLAFRMSLERSVLLTLAFKQRWCRVGTVTPMFATSEHMNLPVYGFLVTPEPLLGVGHIPTPGGQRFNPQLRLNEVTLFSPVWALTLWSVLFAVYLVSLVFAFCVLCWWFCSLKWLKSHIMLWGWRGYAVFGEKTCVEKSTLKAWVEYVSSQVFFSKVHGDI